jgi:polysaccharide deacetylase family protein (PEP-CTERM system associated)
MESVYLTIDVEDWFQVENLRPAFPISTWDSQTWRLEANVDRLLNILDNNDCLATFFVLGFVAERFPDLVNKIADQGHEIASHGYNHALLYELPDEEVVEDLSSSRKLLEDIIGNQVHGYRAPSFSISNRTLELVKCAGYQYDSSYNNFGSHGRYGQLSLSEWEETEPGVYRHYDSAFYEIPIQNLNWHGFTIPWGGGGYFRFIPLDLFMKGISKILETKPYIFYLHPWEIDEKQPEVQNISIFNKLRHYYNISETANRFQKLVKKYRTHNLMKGITIEGESPNNIN